MKVKTDNSITTRDEVNEDRPRDLYKKPEGKSMTSVLMENGIDIGSLNDDFNSSLLQSMSEWAAIQCAEKDKEIKELREAYNKEISDYNNEIQQLEEIISDMKDELKNKH